MIAGVHREQFNRVQSNRSSLGWEVVDLFVTEGCVHCSVKVVVVVWALGGVHWQQQVVCSQAVSLRVSIRKQARLEHPVLTEQDTWKPENPM